MRVRGWLSNACLIRAKVGIIFKKYLRQVWVFDNARNRSELFGQSTCVWSHFLAHGKRPFKDRGNVVGLLVLLQIALYYFWLHQSHILTIVLGEYFHLLLLERGLLHFLIKIILNCSIIRYFVLHCFIFLNRHLMFFERLKVRRAIEVNIIFIFLNDFDILCVWIRECESVLIIRRLLGMRGIYCAARASLWWTLEFGLLWRLIESLLPDLIL